MTRIKQKKNKNAARLNLRLTFLLVATIFITLLSCASEEDDTVETIGETENEEGDSTSSIPSDIQVIVAISAAIPSAIPGFLKGQSNSTYTPTDDHCEVPGSEEGQRPTQTCMVTPTTYTIGVMAVYLLACQDADKIETECIPSFGSQETVPDDHVASRQTLLELDAPLKTVLTEAGSTIEAELTLPIDGDYSANQIVFAYQDQSFPENEFIAEYLWNKAYRICLSPDDVAPEFCEATGAKMGDYLIDMDGDGIFQFLNLNAVNQLEEIGTRPSDYHYYDSTHVGLSVGNPDYEYTDGSYFATGYFAPWALSDGIKSFSSTLHSTITITFDLFDTFRWTDGADQEFTDPSICIDEVAASASGVNSCSDLGLENKDVGSVAIFDPFYDSAFLPFPPDASVDFD